MKGHADVVGMLIDAKCNLDFADKVCRYPAGNFFALKQFVGVNVSTYHLSVTARIATKRLVWGGGG